MAINGEIAAYLGENGQLVDWHGNVLGTYKVVSRWRTPGWAISGHMCAVHATVDGVLYKGRAAGVQMLFRGKVAALPMRKTKVN